MNNYLQLIKDYLPLILIAVFPIVHKQLNKYKFYKDLLNYVKEAAALYESTKKEGGYSDVLDEIVRKTKLNEDQARRVMSVAGTVANGKLTVKEVAKSLLKEKIHLK